MAAKRKFYPAQAETLGERQVRVVCSTAAVDRFGEVVDQLGLNTEAYMANPIVLWQHDPECPVGVTRELQKTAEATTALIEFAPAGISPKADEICGLVKSGIIATTSIGFDFADDGAEPMLAGQPKGPLHYRQSELLEISFVSIPANPEAAVVARAHRAMRAAAAPRLRSLYDVGELACVLNHLGCIQDWSAWEASVEQDGSQVPAMLAEAMASLGEALLAMTKEEIDELLASATIPETVIVTEGEDADYIEAGKTPAVQRFRAGLRRRRLVPVRPPVPVPISRERLLRKRAAELAALA